METFPALLKRIIELRAWERRITRGQAVELSSLRELITEKPIRGWGEDPKKVEAVIKDNPEVLAMFREAMKDQGGDRVSEEARAKCNSVTLRSGVKCTGNSRAYSISRVQKDCDAETVEAVMSGKMSPNAALVKSGIRENRQIYIPRNPAQAAEKLCMSFGDEFAQEIARAVLEGCEVVEEGYGGCMNRDEFNAKTDEALDALREGDTAKAAQIIMKFF